MHYALLFIAVQMFIVVKSTSRPGEKSKIAKYCADPHYSGGLGQYTVHTELKKNNNNN